MERKQEDLEGHTARPFTSPAASLSLITPATPSPASASASTEASSLPLPRGSPVRRPATSHRGLERSVVSDFALASPFQPRFNTIRPATVGPGGRVASPAGRQALFTDTLATPKHQRATLRRPKDSFAFLGGKDGPAFVLTAPSRDGLGHEEEEEEEDGQTRTRT